MTVQGLNKNHEKLVQKEKKKKIGYYPWSVNLVSAFISVRQYTFLAVPAPNISGLWWYSILWW